MSSDSDIFHLICDEFDREWRDGKRPRIEDFLARIDASHRADLLNLLIAIDLDYRISLGEPVESSDYVSLGDLAVSIAQSIVDENRDAKTRSAARSSNQSRVAEGCEIGPYRLVRKIGTGGMGAVWEAEQTKDVERRVAIKLIRNDLASEEIVTRFKAERQALAMMDHPNIAKVLDAGTTEDGNPYFVMELVDGIPLNEYCDQNRMSIRDRLDLIVDVCNAVQHAHIKGVIHRDLKPSNVLVTTVDGKPAPKVIDFGLAKAIDRTAKLTNETIETQFGQVVGTLQYMSPEQAELTSEDIDSRTDIYSLGVVLYELLTGSTPLEKETIGATPVLKVLEIIREKDPLKPSHRLSSTAHNLNEIGNCRKISPSRLQSILHGELDWVVMKALEKDRDRRYETARSFAEDIQRFLDDEPVFAKPPSVRYKLAKFVRKNRSVVASLATLFAVLVAGVATTSWFAYQASESAKRERIAKEDAQTKGKLAIEKANEAQIEADNNREMLTVLLKAFDSINPSSGANAEMKAREVLFLAQDALEKSKLKDLAKADMLATLTMSFQGVGAYESAVETALECMEIRLRLLGRDHPATCQAMTYLATSYTAAGNIQKAIDTCNDMIAHQTDLFGNDHPNTLTAVYNLANAYEVAGEYPKVLELREKILAKRRAIFGNEHLQTITAITSLSSSYSLAGRKKEGHRLCVESLTLTKKVLGDDHPETLGAMNNVAISYKDNGEIDKAISLNEQTIQLRIKKLGPKHPKTLETKNNLALCYEAKGDFDRANEINTEMLQLRIEVLGEDHPRTLDSRMNLGLSLAKAGRFPEAIDVMETCLRKQDQILGPLHPDSLTTINALANLYMDNKQMDVSVSYSRKALDRVRIKLGREDQQAVFALNEHRKMLRYAVEDATVLIAALEFARAESMLNVAHENRIDLDSTIENLSELMHLVALGKRQWGCNA